MDGEGDEFHKNAKKNEAKPAILTEQTWSIKDLLYGKKNHRFLAGYSG